MSPERCHQPRPRPPELPALAPETLSGIYGDNREYIEASAAMAEVDGHHERAETLRAMAQPGRQFLSFDARAEGRAVEVIGNPERAEKISVLVPSADVFIPRAPWITSVLSSSAIRTAIAGACSRYPTATDPIEQRSSGGGEGPIGCPLNVITPPGRWRAASSGFVLAVAYLVLQLGNLAGHMPWDLAG